MPGMTGFEVLAELVRSGSDAEKVVLTAHGSLEKAVEAMKLGADDFLSKPADFEILKRVTERALEKRRLVRVNRALIERTPELGSMIAGTSPAMRDLALAERAAASDAVILITGESGTGKQVVAEHIHRLSPRSAGPFVYVNCVAISDELIESTLFGHEKGAFTGAVGKKSTPETAGRNRVFWTKSATSARGSGPSCFTFWKRASRTGGGTDRPRGLPDRAPPAAGPGGGGAGGGFREDLYFGQCHQWPSPAPEREDIPALARIFPGGWARLKRKVSVLAGLLTG
jgi:CheY-like chemotaxis protein